MSNRQSWGSNPGCLALESLFSTTILCFPCVVLFNLHNNPNFRIRKQARRSCEICLRSLQDMGELGFQPRTAGHGTPTLCTSFPPHPFFCLCNCHYCRASNWTPCQPFCCKLASCHPGVWMALEVSEIWCVSAWVSQVLKPSLLSFC